VIRRSSRSSEPVEDALSGALMNAGPIIHPPLILMNAGPLEHFERWDIHKEGTQPSIRRVTDALDAERIAARVALGYTTPHSPLRPPGDGRARRRAHRRARRARLQGAALSARRSLQARRRRVDVRRPR